MLKFVQEIIEFPCLALNTRTLTVDAEFHTFVRPVERPLLTDFCSELTGITQVPFIADIRIYETEAWHISPTLIGQIQNVLRLLDKF